MIMVASWPLVSICLAAFYNFLNIFFLGSFLYLSPTSLKIWWKIVVYYGSLACNKMRNGLTYKIHTNTLQISTKFLVMLV